MKSDNPIHPGEMLLEEFLAPQGISQRKFASSLGWTPAKLSEIITGKRGVTADSALDLGAITKTNAEVWLSLQMYYDLHQAELKRAEAS